MTVSLDAVRREIIALHDFFTAWYRAEDVPFEQLEAALDASFRMVTPDGRQLERRAVIDLVRAGHGQGGVTIDTRLHEIIAADAGLVVARYEEWQHFDKSEEGRISTALFRLDAAGRNGLRWLDVQETWLPSLPAPSSSPSPE